MMTEEKNSPTARGVGRRSFMSVMAAMGGAQMLLSGNASADDAAPDPVMQQWAIFRSKYLRSDGRIIDTGNGGESHSEGQGYGMLFAAEAGDLAAFEAIWVWARTNLQHTDDKLFSWRYLSGHQPPVPDKNNATDGDLLIALALGRAGKRFKRADFVQDAMAIYGDVVNLMTMKVGPYVVLMPGKTGFIKKDSVILNLSYYVMPSLLQAFDLTADPRWRTVMKDGLRLVSAGRFGQWRLPPDWLAVNRTTGALSIAPGWPPRFSYDAIRVPLYLYWAHMLAPDVLADFSRFWNNFGASALPGWVDLTTGARSPYNAPPGYLAVAECTGLDSAGELPTLDHAPDYYSAALTLLVYIARAEETIK
ncbi:glycosyl hydrolase family 8 [Gluconacetobacter entanii]|uniref:Glucanase n=1 Tax=Gluconacetobacter entanii TaxID=108528 RepID=A0ABT3K9T1_9PROT|nr:glycosyl hydrolase family 8 [Gluconacetobacter entanii]MCW4579775.1 glycosyl hydrolase family 8 [Gluconacetobacter entanii]MCW4583161.1 glycosyl hydrolase family 8 [Gluconacetobacter entanii]MCW4591846.1 glycosyl hydrolase family 8 [Gluconacetobacter entanii]MCW4595032.1 glycosyl hydrolase family 8 [Gluconacetobacter entanii]NPC87921.1 endoglucanase [Gluconacetobacter entanii]